MGSSESKTDKDNQKQNIIVNTKIVLVKIPIFSTIWEKTYNVEVTLEKIAQDFKMENDMDGIDDNHYIEWTYKYFPIKMNETKLKDFMVNNNIDDLSTIEINQEVKPVQGEENLNNYEPCEIVGKPLSNPFEIFTYEPLQKIIKCKTYNKKIIAETQLDKYSIESAYCNGNNHLFISGGVNPVTRESIDLFWDIDLKEINLGSPIKIIPKKNHSMLYDNKKVYIIGGDDQNCIYIDVEKKSANNLSNLNMKRFEPSLIKIDNYLFCFDSSRKKGNDKYSIEKINLNNLDNTAWEIIYPNISPQLGDNVYNQKFFGVVQDYRKNIIFLGGIYDNLRNDNSEENKIKMNTKYNIKKNTMDISDIPFKDISFSEKTFLPLDNKNFFMLPNFTKREPKIIYFNKEKNTLNFSTYKSNQNATKKKKNYSFKASSQMKNSLFGLNFDMPGLHKEIDLNNNNKKTDNLIIIEPNNVTLNSPNLLNNNNSKAVFEYGPKSNTNININNGNLTNEMNQEAINININPNANLNQNIDTNINSNINANINPSFEANINHNIDSNENPNTETSFIPKIDSNLNQKIETKVISSAEINPSNIKISMNENQEHNTKDSQNINGNITNEKKSKNNDITIIPKSERTYMFNRNFKVNFHNSVDDPCHTIRRIKVKNLPYPETISTKMIKLKAKEILKSQNNEILLNNY